MSTIAKVWKVRRPLVGVVTKDDFTFEEETLPAPKDGEFLAEAVYLTVDPYMKVHGTDYESGDVVASENGVTNQVARITAYCSFIYDCQPKHGDVVVVNAAAGACGCLIVQIAKAVGCTVIAYAGTDEKVAWLKDLGADHAYNYKKTDLAETLEEAAPDGVDCFVDHVGGTTFSTVLNAMRKNGRVSVVGAISQYNKTPDQLDKIVFNSMAVIYNAVNIRGFIAPDYYDKTPEVIAKMLQWNKEGKVTFPEKIVDGFENMLDAFLSIFSGEENFGKVIIKV